MDKPEVGTEKEKSLNFIEHIVKQDLETGKYQGNVHTRFPPEPNGYLHIGHAKSICLNFGIAEDYNGITNLRFDDTNPSAEEVEYVNAIREDVKWLGYDWEDREYFSSNYFDQLYGFAVDLIKLGKAFVCDLTQEEIAQRRGTPTQPGEESPYRNRSVEENLALFEGMKNGDFEEGTKVLRAKIDMSSPNMHLRDPAVYRIKKVPHHRTGTTWSIYPMYDYAHCMSDSIEKITHSLCTLEFEVHRPLYDWFLDALDLYHPQQIEFARLNLTNTVMSKRKLLELVQENLVSGWDDPRLPTISGLRRRGYTPESIRNFADRIGVAKRDGIIDMQLLEFSIREDLNKTAPRAMVVLDPIKVVITNLPEGYQEDLQAINIPGNEEAGKRVVPFSREIYIERDDFMEDPPKKYFRLAPGGVVRLKYAYIIQCNEVIKDDKGEILEIRCEYFPESKSGEDTSGIKVKGTIHWVSTDSAIEAELRMYDRLFTVEDPIAEAGGDGDWKSFINPDSLVRSTKAKLEPSLISAQAGNRFQFERKGYFCLDQDSKEGSLVFNQTVALRDSWAKQQKK